MITEFIQEIPKAERKYFLILKPIQVDQDFKTVSDRN